MVAAIVMLVVIWAAVVGVVVLTAARRGRNGAAWAIAGLFFGLFALIPLWIAGPTEAERLRRAQRDEAARQLVREGRANTA